MKKILRLQQMQLFLNGKKKFTVQDIMQELQISRSTALRYIADMEEIGIPFYSERGRHGGFLIASTYQLAPIRFSADEIKAMLFAISSMDVFQSTPFKQQFSLINDKLKQVLPKEEQTAYHKLQKHLAVRTIKQIHKTLYLDTLLQHTLNKQNIRLTLTTGKVYSLRPVALWYESGKWFVAGYAFNVNDLRVIRCDLIARCQIETNNLQVPDSLTLDDYHLGNVNTLRQPQKQLMFYIHIQNEGLEHFYSRAFTHIQVQKTKQGTILSAPYHEEEFEYVLDYINGFSRYLIDIEPAELKQQYCEMVKTRLHKLQVVGE
ncbi:helix-turn-helix transcriptional regulator [Zophobihabitans entericus]|uniref:WYL domain-containing protein n=1 Tax=Zophobihabitans entericus TaxID=1635327 RepID=A0A6G9I897_9GAMM|nr:WYL domain-containing protein [Zophobihabitans entericus]QIQ20435.1 WYL domain-containing protein [Zophobihabitans entericus]